MALVDGPVKAGVGAVVVHVDGVEHGGEGVVTRVLVVFVLCGGIVVGRCGEAVIVDGRRLGIQPGIDPVDGIVERYRLARQLLGRQTAGVHIRSGAIASSATTKDRA